MAMRGTPRLQRCEESGGDSEAAGDRTGDWALIGAAPMAKALGAAEWARVERHSLFEHTTRQRLLEAIAGTPWEVPLREGHQEDEPDPEETRRLLAKWEDLQRERRRQDVAAVWRKVGRFLVGLGPDAGDGDATWRRLYLTEVAPWADYAAGDEYRFLGLPAPVTPSGAAGSPTAAGRDR